MQGQISAFYLCDVAEPADLERLAAGGWRLDGLRTLRSRFGLSAG